ncbi:ABC-type transport auxiliary lipoprotein family protein [Phenylobacterium sp. J367]|uniref:ABC-type transport auxiliary lipoprotein family protein n=1 Tax=Phenylobacterium sp. J367 TaxID=2898435 RepID=UPI00215109D9|nr:ABC-type transport auxiliary lipoprotein family protein [Phenylobacterium sp. J367]MCR5879793.1 ABC-type transport auxiliary lipoprotein family protein [Phenylobacterium sp. J367]
MIRPTALLRFAVIAALGVSLSGCLGGLLGGGKPSQLYRFGQGPVTEAQAPPAAGAVAVFRANGVFQGETAGDRLLAITGGEARYIAESRWVAPASVLWDQAVLAAFDATPGKVRLVSRGELSRAQYVFRMDVRNFETRYDDGEDAAPTVLVRVRAVLTRPRDRDYAQERIFEARVPAASNRVSTIVNAYDRAVGDVLGQVVGWLETEARPVA